jgi:hypothetical protein
MHNLKELIREVLLTNPIKPDCGCGCKGTAKCFDAPILNENLKARIVMTENMQYHIDAKKPLFETTLPYGSKEYLNLWAEARYLYSRGALNVEGIDKEKITETHLGEYGMYEGKKVPLDLPMLDEELEEYFKIGDTININPKAFPSFKFPKGTQGTIIDINKADYAVDDLVYTVQINYIDGQGYPSTELYVEKSIQYLNEAEYRGRKVQLGKPMQGDVKKFKVYVKNAKGNVVKVNFGFGGKSAKGKRMVIKDKNPKRRAAFRARHNCKNPGPRWRARYWSCKKW